MAISPRPRIRESSVSVNKKVIIICHDELLESKGIKIIFRIGSQFLASGFFVVY